MKVFISWSGERSEALAKALREWFPLILHFADPWLSKSDIQAGERWSIEVAKELEGSNFGVICISRENLNSAWILFEAGALAKSMEDGRVIPLLLDLDFKEISGPLAQFQAKKTDNNGIKDIVWSLNKAAQNPVQQPHLERLFDALWDDLEKQIASIPKSGAPTKHNRPQGEILEELVSSVRNVEVRVRDSMDDDIGIRRRRRSKFSPMMIRDVTLRLGKGPSDPVQLLILSSLLRDDAPWLYELALEAYRAIRSNSREANKAINRFVEAIEMLFHGSFSEELGIDRTALKVLREFLEIYQIKKFDEEIANPGTKEVTTNPNS